MKLTTKHILGGVALVFFYFYIFKKEDESIENNRREGYGRRDSEQLKIK